MMAERTKYLTGQELVARLGQEEADQLLGKGLRNNRELDMLRAETEIQSVDAVIEGYVRARYPRGFGISSSTNKSGVCAYIPAVLKGICFDLVRFRLRGQGGQSSAMADVVKTRYDEALKLLRDIADGRVTLDADGDGNQPESGTHADTVKACFPESRMKKALEGYR